MSSFQMRSYQETAVQCALNDFAAGAKHILEVLPTGSGKTEIFVRLSRRFLDDNPDKCVLILSHMTLLTEQTKERFQLRDPSIKVGVLQAQQRPRWDNRVIISTMQTSRSKANIDWLDEQVCRKVGLIIVDEAHYILTPSYQQILSYFPDVKVAGFTATPFRDRQVMTNYFEKVSYSISLQDLIDQKHLVPPKLNEIVTKGSGLADVMATVMHLYREHCSDRQAIVYMQTIDDARVLRTAFEEAGISAESVTQEMVGDFRTQTLKQFNAGVTRVLVTVNVLTAGFDSPNVGAIFMPYGTSSPTTYLQRIGRGLRPMAGKSDCLVFVFGDAPSVSNKIYEHMTRKILSAGGQLRDHGSFRADILYNDYVPTSDAHVWTTTVVEAINKMEKLGMNELAKLLDNKQFPQRFLDNISQLLATLPNKKTSMPGGQKAATQSQQAVLFRAGFGNEVIGRLTKNEASMMIGSIFNQENRQKPKDKEFLLPDGTYAGKHVTETPHAYRSLVKKRFPDSPVAKVILNWEKGRRQA